MKFLAGFTFAFSIFVLSVSDCYPCPIPVKNHTTLANFTTVQAAVNDTYAADFDTIQITAADFYEDVLYGQDVILILSGGWDCDFLDNPNPSTSYINSLTISNGTAIVENIVISSLPEVIEVRSVPLHFSSTGWAGWSCPSGTTVVGGGYEPPEHIVFISEAAEPNSNSGLYPVYPHWTFTPPETGWVVQNGGEAATLTIYALCAVN